MGNRITETIEKLVEDRKELLNALATPENFKALKNNQLRLATITGFDFSSIPAIYR